MLIKEVMKKPVVTDRDLSLTEAAKIMGSKGVGSILYILKGELKGIVTERDILRNFNTDKRISDIMVKRVAIVSPDAELDYAMTLMREQEVKRLPVADKGGKVIGIVTIMDVIARGQSDDDESFLLN